MSKKDFELIAWLIARSRDDFIPGGAKRTAQDFADALAQTNPLFNRQKFLATCGVLGE